MTEDMPTVSVEMLLRKIGAKLRAARESKNLSLQEISYRTRINSIFLEQIEAGRTEKLPGLTFVRGFIRNYLQALGIQDEEIETQLEGFAGLQQYKAETRLGPKINEMHGDEHTTQTKLPRGVVLGLIAISVVVFVYVLISLLSPSSKNPPPAAIDQPSEEVQPAPEQQPPSAEPSAAAPPAELPKGAPLGSLHSLRLTVRGLEPTWIRLSVDRAPPIEVHLEPAETMNWEANEEFRLIIGKSHGVAVYLNGEDILLPEERGQLIPDITLNKLTLLRLEN